MRDRWAQKRCGGHDGWRAQGGLEQVASDVLNRPSSVRIVLTGCAGTIRLLDLPLSAGDASESHPSPGEA